MKQFRINEDKWFLLLTKLHLQVGWLTILSNPIVSFCEKEIVCAFVFKDNEIILRNSMFQTDINRKQSYQGLGV